MMPMVLFDSGARRDAYHKANGSSTVFVFLRIIAILVSPLNPLRPAFKKFDVVTAYGWRLVSGFRAARRCSA